MHRLNPRVLGLGVTVVAALSIALALVITTFGSFGSPDAHATGGVGSPTPTPTTKNAAAGGVLTGVSDIVVDGSLSSTPNPAVDAYHCISYTQDHGDGTLKTAATCFDNAGALANNDAEPLNDAVGEGVQGDAGAVGPPPPPPYSPAVPAKGNATLSADTLVAYVCFAELGPPVGPNIISKLTVVGAVAQLNATGYQHATTDIYENQPDSACDSLTPIGTPTFAALGATLYPATDTANCPASNCLQSPFRVTADTDFDNDGCTDQAELDKLDSTDCGDDPWNPNDTNLADTDVAGDYSLVAAVTDADCNPAATGNPAVCELPGDSTAGLYYSCDAAIEQNGKVLKAFASCYIDSPAFAINPEMGATCPNRCGDGFPGSPPPGVTVSGSGVRNFADVDTKNTVLTGTLDNTKDLILLNGCFEDLDGQSPLGDVYVQASIDSHAGHGFVAIYGMPDTATCNAGTPLPTPAIAQLSLARQRKGTLPMRDSDSDGCGDRREMGDPGNTTSTLLTQAKGALRDPANHYDYMNPTHDGLNRVDDILKTVGQYFKDDADATPGFPPFSVNYNQDTDRTALIGGNPWNLGAPNGQQRVDDILASVKQYFQDCNVNNFS